MDIFDIFALLPIGPVGRDSGETRTTEENLVGGLCRVVFPIVNFCLVLFTGVWRHLAIAAFVLPLVYTAASVLFCRLVGSSGSWTFRVAFSCAVMCFIAGGAALLLAVFMDFFRAF
ncbi:MAG TPA: hypothetical protein VF545_01345 [Thermoleophilaceae bacterium]|jgi:uncharacterized membrane protein